RDWIATAADEELGTPRCGGMPAAGLPGAAIVDFTGVLSGERPAITYSVAVPTGTNELRIAMNGRDDGQTNFHLYAKANRQPSAPDYDCHATGTSQYAYCGFSFPAAGTWNILVERVSGAGAFQLTTTVIGGDAPVCGNDVRETGEAC